MWRTSRDHLMLALRLAGHVAWEWDVGSDVVVRSDNSPEVLGAPATQREGGLRSLLELVHPDDRHRVEAALAHAMAEGTGYRAEYRLVRPDDGRTIWVEDRGDVVLDEQGCVARIGGVVFDISERKDRRRAEDRLHEISHWFETIIDAAPVAVLIVGVDGCVRLWNGGAERLFGWTREEAVGRILPGLEGVDHDRFVAALGETLAGRPMDGLEARFVRRDGGTAYAAIWSATLLDAEHRPSSVLVIAADLMARKDAERADARLAAIVESSEDAIIGLALDGTITSWNRGAQRLFGHGAEVIGAGVDRLAPPELSGETRRMLAIVARGGRVENLETERIRKDGATIAVAITISPILDAGGSVIGASEIARDISERRAADMALRQAKETAEAASRAKDQFLAVLSHELRTPLAPVMALVGKLERSRQTPVDMRHDLAVIRRNVELEARLIDDLLDLTRIGRGQLILHREPIDVRQPLRDAMQACWTREPEDKHLRLQLEFGAREHVVEGDPARLTQVFWNLLSNAIKFTGDGGLVTVRTRNVAGRVVVDIVDTGIGIPEDVLPYIFEPFDQGEPSVAREFGGLGLGLAISRSIVDLHEGCLSASSSGAGGGSAFSVELPLGTGIPAMIPPFEQAHRPQGTAVASDPLHILLVEDHADTAEAMSMLLEGMGYKVSVARTLAEAQHIAGEAGREDAPPSGKIGLVISDLDLPDGSGLDLMRHLVSAHGLRGIALSGFGMEEDVRRSREAGFHRHLIKPINLQVLEEAIAAIARSAG